MVKKAYDINHFYKSFSMKKKVSFDLYKKIIKTFLTVYFREVLFSSKPIYFLFGGKVEKVKVGNFVGRKDRNNTERVFFKPAVGFQWFDRPCKTMDVQIKLKKLNGSTSSLTKVIKEWTSKNDISTLKKRSRWQVRD